jgi:hypothetical protein
MCYQCDGRAWRRNHWITSESSRIRDDRIRAERIQANAAKWDEIARRLAMVDAVAIARNLPPLPSDRKGN